MFDINEIRKRAQQASGQAAAYMEQALEKSGELTSRAQISAAEPAPAASAAEAEAQLYANRLRHV